MSDVTRILSQIESGDPSAAELLLPLVYDELRKLAAAKLAHEKPGQTLQATALVHEAYLRLVDVGNVMHWNSRAHFFGAVAEAMRRILVENVRRRSSLKRGGGLRQVSLDDDEFALDGRPEELLTLDAAFDRLALQDSAKAELVKLRFFAGMTSQEAAQVLGISVTTADRYWTYARAWLQREIVESRS